MSVSIERQLRSLEAKIAYRHGMIARIDAEIAELQSCVDEIVRARVPEQAAAEPSQRPA